MSLYASVEMDVDDLMARGIYSCAVKVTYTDNPPECVDGQGRWNNSYVNGNSRPERHSNGGIHNFLRKSTALSPVYIYHTLATDDPDLGDRFGASIETCYKSKLCFYRHLVKQVEENGVADKMQIRDGDELVLINDVFAPDLDHLKVIELFRKIPVDSHTKLSLVFRRYSSENQWIWVSTSAILVPEFDREPGVRHLVVDKETGPTYIGFSRWYRLQIPGTQLYLVIKQGQVQTDVAKTEDMKSYNICVTTKCHFDSSKGMYTYLACIGNYQLEQLRNNYVEVTENGKVDVNTEPDWFGFKIVGRGMSFEVLACQKYLGCNVSDCGTRGRLCLQEERFFFNSYPTEDGYDETDTASNTSEPVLHPLLLENIPGTKSRPDSEPTSLNSSRSSRTSGYSSQSDCKEHIDSSAE